VWSVLVVAIEDVNVHDLCLARLHRSLVYIGSYSVVPIAGGRRENSLAIFVVMQWPPLLLPLKR